MRRKQIPIFAIATAAVAVAATAAIAFAIVTRQPWLTLLAAAFTAALVTASIIGAITAANHYVRTNDSTLTRIRGLERKLTTESSHQRELDKRIEEDLRRLRLQAEKESSDRERLASELQTRIHELDGQLKKEHAQRQALSAELANAKTKITRLTENGKTWSADITTLKQRTADEYLEPLRKGLERHEGLVDHLLRSTFEFGVQLGKDPKVLLSGEHARILFASYLAEEKYIQLRPLIETFDLLPQQNLADLRALYRYFRKAGYWNLAATTLNEVCQKSCRSAEELTLEKQRHEIEFYRDPLKVKPPLPAADAYDSTGTILHIVGHVLPQKQTGYTLRTHYTALAQARRGLEVAVVCHSGASKEPVAQTQHYTHQGIDYYILPGPAKNQCLVDDWAAHNMRQLAELVVTLKPSILHAHSDFFNGVIANAVGKHYGIPVIYESRGFWEESWLFRTASDRNWEDSETDIFDTYGMPEAYTLRKQAEQKIRHAVDHVFTLADVMRDHILSTANGRIPAESVSLVPNAVDSAEFPRQERDSSLATEIGLPEGAVTIGYISSMLAYEGIDTLIEAHDRLSRELDVPICLLLVGDGQQRPILEETVKQKGIRNVIFTGTVPHSEVLKYYGLIDIFVIPRKPSTVADLVTPLKPFEAFSTGRAVIASDVRALKEIADKSKAVRLFQAGSASDLADSLRPLIISPTQRKQLGERASSWVRNHRTWDSNVSEYYRVYRLLGYKGQRSIVSESELELTRQGINPGELVEMLRAAPLSPTSGWFSIETVRQSASEVVNNGWQWGNFEPVWVIDRSEWASPGATNRSLGFNLHAWEFMDPFLTEYDEQHDPEVLAAALGIAVQWIEIHRHADETNDPMVWYDMSQALRTPRLIALATRAARVPDFRDETVILIEAIGWHLRELSKDRAFNARNNHGFFTAVSQLHAARYAPMFSEAQSAGDEGRRRLAIMTESQFAPDGVHLEHSPDYHRMLLASFEAAVSEGFIVDAEIKNRIEKAASVLGWMVQPDGTLVQFGDSPATVMVNNEATSIDPETEFILTDGARGRKPVENMAVYTDGGYAFVRSPQPSAPGELINSSYFAFSAAFHSRAHKHADDLNVVWFDHGQQILTDAGRFGYGELLEPDSPLRQSGFYYAEEERQYVESTVAHNTLMMDGQIQDRRHRKPYGSAITDCFERPGVFDISGRVHHSDYIHRRRAVFRPGQELLLKDSVFSHTLEKREAVLWFNFDGSFEVQTADEVAVEFISPSTSLIVRVESDGALIAPVRGQREPLRGWRSRQDRELEAVWSLGFSFSFEERASIDTRITLQQN